MAHDDRIVSLVLDAQRRIGRLAERDYGLSLKAISLDTGIPYPSVRSYLGQGDVKLAVMPVPVMLKLVGVIPDDLLSQLLDPVKRCIVRTDDSDEPDYDAIGQGALELAGEVQKSRRPDSPGGTNIVPIEKQAINAKRARLLGEKAA